MMESTMMRREAPFPNPPTGPSVLVHTMRDAHESKDAVRPRNGKKNREEGRLQDK